MVHVPPRRRLRKPSDASEADAPLAEFPLAQRSEIIDGGTCPLCRAVDGRIVSRRSPAYRLFHDALHINCRGCWVYIGRDEVDNYGRRTRPDWPALTDMWTDESGETHTYGDLVAWHGHFLSHPDRYAALNVPARPTGRDLIVFIGPDRNLGRNRLFAGLRQNLPDWALEETLRWVAATLPDSTTALDLPSDPDLLRQILAYAPQGLLPPAPGLRIGRIIGAFPPDIARRAVYLVSSGAYGW